jgi:hypothetical protein
MVKMARTNRLQCRAFAAVRFKEQARSLCEVLLMLYSVEQIVAVLEQAELGVPVARICFNQGISE